VEAQLDDQVVFMEMDTGAAATLISEQMWRKIGRPPLTPSHKLFTTYDGHRMKPLGEWRCCIRVRNKAVSNAAITVVHSSKPHGLLGRDLLVRCRHRRISMFTL
jgi:hypothetical protein